MGDGSHGPSPASSPKSLAYGSCTASGTDENGNPLPSCARLLAPQHASVPACEMPQACSLPMLAPFHGPTLGTFCGDVNDDRLPSASCP